MRYAAITKWLREEDSFSNKAQNTNCLFLIAVCHLLSLIEISSKSTFVSPLQFIQSFSVWTNMHEAATSVSTSTRDSYSYNVCESDKAGPTNRWMPVMQPLSWEWWQLVFVCISWSINRYWWYQTKTLKIGLHWISWTRYTSQGGSSRKEYERVAPLFSTDFLK